MVLLANGLIFNILYICILPLFYWPPFLLCLQNKPALEFHTTLTHGEVPAYNNAKLLYCQARL